MQVRDGCGQCGLVQYGSVQSGLHVSSTNRATIYISEELDGEGIQAGVVEIWKFLRKYDEHVTTWCLPGSGHRSLVTRP